MLCLATSLLASAAAFTATPAVRAPATKAMTINMVRSRPIKARRGVSCTAVWPVQ